MIGAELFRQGPRPVAMAVAGVVNWLGTFIIAMFFESVQVRLSLLSVHACKRSAAASKRSAVETTISQIRRHLRDSVR